MPDIIVEAVEEPVIEATVVNDVNSIDIINILKQDAIDYAIQRNSEKEFVDFYKHIKDEIYDYRYNNIFNSDAIEDELESLIDNFNEKYENIKKHYIYSNSIYEYTVKKLIQLNIKYNLGIGSDITHIRRTYDEDDNNSSDEEENEEENNENQEENPED